MADQRTANRRRLGRLSQQDWRSGARTARPFLFKVDGGNIPKLRDNESSKSFLKRIKDWEKFTGKTYPKSKQLNQIKLRGTGGNKDYSQGSNWADEKKEWVSETEAALQQDPNLAEDMRKEAFLANPNEKRDYGPGGPIPTNQEELNKAAENERLTKQNRINNASSILKKADKDGEALEVQNDEVAEKTQELVDTARAEVAAAKENLKTNVFTRHYKTGKRLGVMTKRQRLAYEKEAGTKTFEGQMEKYGLDPNDPRRETKYTSKSWRAKQDLLIKQQEQQNKKEIQIGGNNKEKQA